MKKNILKTVIVGILCLSLVWSFSGNVSSASHAADGADVVPDNIKWNGYSICTREDGGEWEDALKEVYKTNADGSYFLDADGNKQTFVKGVDYATEGWISGQYPMNSREVTFFCKNTGWDGEYAVTDFKTKKQELVSDNPWGMTLKMDGIPVEFGRYYTMEFDIGNTMQKGNYNELTHKTTYVPAEKHILFKAYDYLSKGGPAAQFESVYEDGEKMSTDGFITLKKEEDVPKDGYSFTHQETQEVPTAEGETTTAGQEPETQIVEKTIHCSHVKAVFKIPDTREEWGGGKGSSVYTHMGICFALGANLVSYKDETSMSGNIFVRNVKVTANTQYLVRYLDGNTVKTSKYINAEESATAAKLTKKGYTLVGYKDLDTGKKYNFANEVNSNLRLQAIWSKTPAAGKASFKAKSKKKKKVTVTFGTCANAKGYDVMYSYNKKFSTKKKYKTKTKTSSSTASYTIGSLKRSSVVYVKARAFNKDSTGNKIYGAWSGTKAVYVR